MADWFHSTGEYNLENRQKMFSDRFPYGHNPKREGLGLRIYDVGVDANHYRPISLVQIAEFLGVPSLHEAPPAEEKTDDPGEQMP